MLSMWQAIHSFLTNLSGFVQGAGSPSRGSVEPRRNEVFADRITVVALGTTNHDRQLLDDVGTRNRWSVIFVDTCDQARTALERLQSPVIVFDRDLPGREWQDTMKILAGSSHRACIVLSSTVVDSYLLDEVVSRGGYDVVSKPLREEDIVHAIKLAWSYRNVTMRAAPVRKAGASGG